MILTSSRSRLLIAALVAIGVGIRILALPGPGFASDVGTFAAWAERLAESGPGSFYEPGYFADYPPAFLYVLWLLGALFDGEALRLVVKGISIPFDVGIALLLAAFVARRAGRAAGVAATGLWMLAPAQVVAGTFWGQTDAVGTLPLLGAALAAGARRWVLAGSLAALAAMIKPQYGIGLIVLLVLVVLELRQGSRRPLRALAAALAVVLALGLPFGVGPLQLLALVRDAAATYPYSTLYAFNIWAQLVGFWKPDDGYVLVGGALLALGIAGACLTLLRRRDSTGILIALGLAALAFYFLPTRAHERYLYPALALLLPVAIEQRRLLVPYVAMALGFAGTLLYALTRYPQNGVPAPDLLEQSLFTESGTSVLIVVMLVSGAALAFGALRHDATDAAAVPDPDPVGTVPLVEVQPAARASLPPGLGAGRAPDRRTLLLAIAVALAMLVTRAYRVDQPKAMYFDEVYHARTAYELLAQREPYEWTHPHLAKEIMAIGILVFGDNRVIGEESTPAGVVAFTVSNDGVRAYGRADGTIELRERDGRARIGARLSEVPRALAFDGAQLFALTDNRLFEIPRATSADVALVSVNLPFSGGTALSATGGRLVVGGPAGVAIYEDLTGPPVLVRLPARAITAKPDGSELYILDLEGVVHVVQPGGQKLREIAVGTGQAIAYAEGPNRLFVASSDLPALQVVELEGGRRESLPLANARTGDVRSPATALVVVPRTQFLYAAADGKVIVVETHGASPFTAIAAPGDRLGVDGEADTLLVLGDESGARVIETGRNALSWRLPGVVAGALLAFFLVLLARRLFASALVPAFVGAVVLLDGSTFAMPRIGMNDVYVACFVVAGWYFVVAAHARRRSSRGDVLIAGVLFGLALASKWAGLYALAGVFVASVFFTARSLWQDRPGSGGPLDLLAGRGRNAALLFTSFAIIPAALYLLAYRPWFGGPTIPYGWDLAEIIRQMYGYHSGLTSPHPAGSPWWSWLFVLKPVYWYFGQDASGSNAYIYDAGNLILYWSALPATIWLAVVAIRARSVRLGFPVFALLTQYVAWIPITRVLFFYHFFTALPFYLLALGAALAALWERGERTVVRAVLGLAAFAAIFFYPFVSGQPIPAAQAAAFFILPTWQYDCQFYPAEATGFRCDLGTGSVDSSAVLTRLALAAGILALAAVPVLVGRLLIGRRQVGAKSG